MAGGDEGRCPACGAPRDANAVRCTFCGWKFESDAAAVREEYTPDVGPASTEVESLPSMREIQPISTTGSPEPFQTLAEEAPKIAQTARRVWVWVVIGVVALLAVSCVCCAGLGYLIFSAQSAQ